MPADGTCITRVSAGRPRLRRTWNRRPSRYTASNSASTKRDSTGGRAIRKNIAGSSICRARPGQQIAMIWYGNFNGERVLDETAKNETLAGGGVNRTGTCPQENRL